MTRSKCTLLALCLLVAAPVFAQTSVSGDWDVTVISPQGENTTLCTLTQDGVVAGTLLFLCAFYVRPSPVVRRVVVASLGLALSNVQLARGGFTIKFIGLTNFTNLLFGADRNIFLGSFKPATILGWIVFIGGSIAIRTRGHMAIDLLPLALSPANRRRLAIAVPERSRVFPRSATTSAP